MPAEVVPAEVVLLIPGPTKRLWYVLQNQRTHQTCAASCTGLRCALGMSGGEQVEAPTVSRRLLPPCISDWLRWQPLAGWLAGWLADWLNAEHNPRGRHGASKVAPARLALHALGVQPFPRPSRHAKHRQCRLIKQASSQVERWYRDYVVMMTKAHRTRESVVPLGSRVPPLRKPSRMFHRPMSATAIGGT